jgi:hypothetical protein
VQEEHKVLKAQLDSSDIKVILDIKEIKVVKEL